MLSSSHDDDLEVNESLYEYVVELRRNKNCGAAQEWLK